MVENLPSMFHIEHVENAQWHSDQTPTINVYEVHSCKTTTEKLRLNLSYVLTCLTLGLVHSVLMVWWDLDSLVGTRKRLFFNLNDLFWSPLSQLYMDRLPFRNIQFLFRGLVRNTQCYHHKHSWNCLHILKMLTHRLDFLRERLQRQQSHLL